VLGFAEIVGEMANLPTFHHGNFLPKYSTINQGGRGRQEVTGEREVQQERRGMMREGWSDERGAV
jgi:hypothetical protein